MKKFIAIIISVFLLFALNGCGKPSTSKDVENDKDGITETVDDTDSKEKNDSKDTDKEKADQKEEKSSKGKSSKKKYDDISSESEPVGVEVGLESSSNYTYVTGRVYKNSDSPESGYISVTFELYDENDNYICQKAITTDLLEYGENERFSDDIIWEAPDEYSSGVSDELLKQYTVKIVDIEEISGDEGQKVYLLYEIGDAIDEGNYNYASALLEEFKEKYPEETAAIRRVEAYIKDAAQNSGDDEEAIDDEWLNYDFEGLLDDESAEE